MKKIKSIIINIFLTIVLFQTVTAQKRDIVRADSEYDKYAYFDAIEIYKKVVDKGYESPDLFKKIGNSYYFNAELKEANIWYEKLFSIAKKEEIEPEYYYRYSHTLKSIENYTLSNVFLDEFSNLTKNDNRAKLFLSKKDYLVEIKELSGRQNITDAGINSEYSDYGGMFWNNFFVFTSTRDTGGVSNTKHKWTNQSFSNLYASRVKLDGTFEEPELFSKKINSKFNESTPVFSSDGKTIYFTRNNYTDKKKKTDSDKNVLLKIYRSVYDNGEWSKPEELAFNSDEFSCAHPALSADDKTLFFASNMPGTLGMSDIFKVSINDDGSFGNPINLGNKINTESRETFPYITNENELFFASDGHPGLGGLDVFGVKMYDDGTLSKVYNLGGPLNSSSDDFGYIIFNDTKTGFFTSNRSQGKGFDDIYKFTETIPLPYNCKQSITGLAIDEETASLLNAALVQLFDENMNLLKEVITKENGEYLFEELECNKNYIVRISAKEHESVEEFITTDKISGISKLSTNLNKKIKKVSVGSDLAKAFNIKIIYFDLDKSNIRKDAALELQKIVEVLKENPTIKIDVRSHTDSRQTSDYNIKLSDRRAKATIAWMIENGITADRLSGRGYGESQLKNNCSDGVECSEEEHQLNRRSEFIITEI